MLDRKPEHERLDNHVQQYRKFCLEDAHLFMDSGPFAFDRRENLRKFFPFAKIDKIR